MSQIAERLLVRLMVLCTAFSLSACTILGPDYEEPEATWLSKWQSDLYGQIGAQQQSSIDLRFWWRLLDDPVLNRLIELAKQENPSLRIAGLRILEARAQLGIAGSNLYPQLQQLNGAVSYLNTQQHGGVATNRNQSLTSYQNNLNLGWELDFWGRFRRGIESADAAFFASITNHQDVQVLLSAQVASLYFFYRTSALRIAIAQKNAEIQKRSFEITTQLYNSGEQSELDLQQAKTQYLATLSTIPGLEISWIQTRNALGALLGRAPGDLSELAGELKKLPTVKPFAIQGIPARLLLRRPDIRTAAWQVAAQSAQIGIAEADFYPSISLVGGLGWSGNNRNSTPDTGSLVAGPSFTWNIFDHGRISNNVRVQDARLQQLIENFQDSVLQAAREIDDAAISVVKTQEQQEVLSETVVSAKRSLELANVRYREGYASFQRVLDAQRTLFSQADRELVNQGNHISAIVDLYKAIGGGWLETPVEKIIPVNLRDSMESRSDWGDLLSTPLPTTVDTPSTGLEASP